ncbi:hypothetical protein [Thalassovita taeanensis]|uniref:Uncharacterized protein n=1 Tax=Thalassovita taeanensis TaxID=657014 RepID=A0A1H9G9Q1_9RHOB|nr:hypothetical protein [Thalassovita taeanensis]SEQ46875.1 hypothetical protein SAMN04488092_10796 [Thalassovita taeanensis]
MANDVFGPVGTRLTQAVLTGDFKLYRSVMRLPLRIEPLGGQPYELHTDTSLQQDFELYHDVIALNDVNDIFRENIVHNQLADDLIEVTCVTHILHDTAPVVEPFNTLFLLRPTEDSWGISMIRSSIGHINWTLARSRISDDGRFTDD